MTDGSYIQRTYRIREEALNVYFYLEVKAVMEKKVESKSHFFDLLLNWGLDYMELHGTPKLGEYSPMRIIKGFTLKEKTLERLENFYVETKCQYYKGEIIEFCLYLYSKNLLNEPEIEMLKIDEWTLPQ